MWMGEGRFSLMYCFPTVDICLVLCYIAFLCFSFLGRHLNAHPRPERLLLSFFLYTARVISAHMKILDLIYIGYSWLHIWVNLFFLCTPFAGQRPAAGGWLYLSLSYILFSMLPSSLNNNPHYDLWFRRFFWIDSMLIASELTIWNVLGYSLFWAGFCWGLGVVLCCWWCTLLQDESFAAATDGGWLGGAKAYKCNLFWFVSTFRSSCWSGLAAVGGWSLTVRVVSGFGFNPTSLGWQFVMFDFFMWRSSLFFSLAYKARLLVKIEIVR